MLYGVFRVCDYYSDLNGNRCLIDAYELLGEQVYACEYDAQIAAAKARIEALEYIAEYPEKWITDVTEATRKAFGQAFGVDTPTSIIKVHALLRTYAKRYAEDPSFNWSDEQAKAVCALVGPDYIVVRPVTVASSAEVRGSK